ncbi:MAG: NAD(P)H-binding protein [Thermoplasmata archaeon]|nr:NAD(P)H-binding protein [Thermoplasmata archaeon]
MTSSAERPRLLLVGGAGGLVGRAVLKEFSPDWQIRSLHRHAVPAENDRGVEWVPIDLAEVRDWRPHLECVDTVVNLAWYRWGSERRFRGLYEGLRRMVEAASASGIRRLVHVSVPDAPAGLETGIPYLSYKRKLDRDVVRCGVPYRIVRPTMLFGERDVLLTVLVRGIDRYPFFPMFGEGRYHVSPVAVEDLAHVLRREAEGTEVGTLDIGGPVRYEFRELTDMIFSALGKRARYWRLSEAGSLRLAALLQALGSSLLYRYEVEWLLSDRLGLPAYSGLERPMRRVEPFLTAEVARRRGAPAPRSKG